MSYEEQQALNIVIVGTGDGDQKVTKVITELNPGYLHIYGNEGAMPHKT